MAGAGLFTIGYQGAALGDFVACLREHGVHTLADVRYSPFSRRPEFCQGPLRASIEAAGLRYIHLKNLGNIPESRTAAAAGDVARYRAIFRAHLDTDTARTGLDTVRNLLADGPVCLMCLERDPADCHRLMVAERLAAEHLAKGGALVVEHLRPAGPTKPAKRGADQPRLL